MVGQVEKEKQNDGTRKWKFQSLKTIGKFLTLEINYIKAKFIKEKLGRCGQVTQLTAK